MAEVNAEIARKQKELQSRMAVDNAATLEWRVYAAACAEVLGFGAKRLNDLHKAVLENFRQLSAWAIAWMVEASRKRVGCLPLAPAEVEKRIQTVLQAPAMPESWERRRAR